eukprot:COSAG03_NODE_16382_length_403_cov_2.098684_2_plen_21_part_01
MSESASVVLRDGTGAAGVERL